MKNSIYDVIRTTPTADTLWDGAYKIPWNDPAFSARILNEHLSQAHHLASRKTAIIDAQTDWIRQRHLGGEPSAMLDLGCGPGLYAAPLAGGMHHYHGIDFSPASIDHATKTHAGNPRCTFRLGDVTEAEFGGPYDLAMMLYGELNVFSPDKCRCILTKAHAALAPGGSLLIEFQNPTAVRTMAEAPKSWTRADHGGLFSDTPYVCLTENHWFDKEQVALQCFHVMESDGTTATYRSTTKAWSPDEMEQLLAVAGFAEVTFHDNWPVPDGNLQLASATKR